MENLPHYRDAANLASKYPALFAPISWGDVACQFSLLTHLDEKLVSNVNVVPFVGENVVLIELASGEVEIPGGTLEPAETYIDAARRELMEEAGATFSLFVPFGLWQCTSSLALPFRPHIPHPNFIRLVCYADVELVSVPIEGEGAEAISNVEVLPAEEAALRFTSQGRNDLADLYLLAAQLRAQK